MPRSLRLKAGAALVGHEGGSGHDEKFTTTTSLTLILIDTTTLILIDTNPSIETCIAAGLELLK